MPKYDDYNNRERKKLSQKRNSGHNGKFSQKHIRVQIEIQKQRKIDYTKYESITIDEINQNVLFFKNYSQKSFGGTLALIMTTRSSISSNKVSISSPQSSI